MEITTENIIKTFITDTHICAIHGLQLMKYQMEKYKWNSYEWSFYYEVYKENLDKIGLKDEKISCVTKGN